MKKVLLGYILIIFSTLPFMVSAASDGDIQAWLPIKAQGHITNNVLWSSEFETRAIDNVSEFGSQSAAVAFGYQLNDNWSVWQGFKWEGKYDSTADTWSHEYRPFQQLMFGYKYGDYTFKTRTRMEERNFASGEDMSLRFRQLFRGEYALTDKWFLAASEEMFVNLNDTVVRPDGFSQNRLYGGLGYKVSPMATVETGFMRRFDEGFTGADKDTNVWITTIGFNF